MASQAPVDNTGTERVKMITEINDPDVVQAVRACFERYNSALEAGETAVLNAFFWDSPATVRFGPAETLIGHQAIAGFRSSRWKAASAGRTVETLVVTAFSRCLATTNAVFRSGDGTGSRQSQTWVRFAEGWRIVAAHVSPAP